MKALGYLDFDQFFAEVGMVQMGSFSTQMECYVIYQLSLTRSFFPKILIRTQTLFKRFLHTYICLDIYPGTVGVAAIEMYLSQ